MKLDLPNEPQLLKFATEFAQHAPDNATVYLQGELGAGKTTFARGFLQGLGFTGFVKSPTYTIVESYDTNKTKVFHFDLYRIADPEELTFLGIDDYFSQKAIRLIEWSDQGKGYLLPPDILVAITFKDNGREINLSAYSATGNAWINSLSAVK